MSQTNRGFPVDSYASHQLHQQQQAAMQQLQWQQYFGELQQRQQLLWLKLQQQNLQLHQPGIGYASLTSFLDACEPSFLRPFYRDPNAVYDIHWPTIGGVVRPRTRIEPSSFFSYDLFDMGDGDQKEEASKPQTDESKT